MKVSETSKEKVIAKVLPIFDADITVISSAFIYDGAEKQPAVVVRHNNKILTSKDYDVTYTSNINAGTAKVTVTGRGTYWGNISKNFKINPKPISDAKLIITPDSFSYDGNEKTPSVTVKDGNITLSANVDASGASAVNYSVLPTHPTGMPEQVQLQLQAKEIILALSKALSG